MEQDVRKQGLLYLQQHRIGKRWRRVWSVLYRENSCSISRLEFYDCKDGAPAEKSDRTLKKQQENKKVIRMSDCIRVTELEVDGCPRDTGPFLVETTEKIYVFAADLQHLEDWMHKLCQTAFPVSWVEPGLKTGSVTVPTDEGMEENSLYSVVNTRPDFRVCVRRTEASVRCGLRGDGVLRAGGDGLQLLDLQGNVLLSWPYRYLRRFGRDKSTFSFEAGRRSDSGEGSFEFDTKQGELLFGAIEAAISLRCGSASGAPPPEAPGSRAEVEPPAIGRPRDDVAAAGPITPGFVPQVGGSYRRVSDTRQRRPPPAQAEVPQKNQVRTISSCPLPVAEAASPAPLAPHARLGSCLSAAVASDQTYPRGHLASGAPDAEYSLPFDAIGNKVMADIMSSWHAAEPLYDDINEAAIGSICLRDGPTLAAPPRKKDHIYDEPEGCAAAAAAAAAAASVYDEPEEVRGDAWRLMGTTGEPRVQEGPCDPRLGTYAVPRQARGARPPPQGAGGQQAAQEEQREQREPPYKNLLKKAMTKTQHGSP